MRSRVKKIRNWLEALVVVGLYVFFRGMRLNVASAAGEKLGLLLMHVLRHRNIVKRNLELVFPEKSEAERNDIARGMWKHLGRLVAEFMHLPGNGLFSRVSVKGLHHAPVGRPAIYVSAHYGHWELNYPIAFEYGVPITLIYRHANNPYVDRLIQDIRGSHATNMFPKGLRGSAQMIRAMKNGDSLALLADQKMNDGIEVEFFGHKVKAAPAIAMLALKYDMPIIPARVVRTKGAHFEATISPPLAIVKTGNEAEDIRRIVQDIYRMFEAWIREHPEQYFWVHRRFEKSLY